jgi:selenophosphate synthase
MVSRREECSINYLQAVSYTVVGAEKARRNELGRTGCKIIITRPFDGLHLAQLW